MMENIHKLEGKAKILIGKFIISDMLKHIIVKALLNEGYDVEMEDATPNLHLGMSQTELKVYRTETFS